MNASIQPTARYRVTINDVTHEAEVIESAGMVTVKIGRHQFKVDLGHAARRVAATAGAATANEVQSHLPGVVDEVLVKPGQQVEEGQELVVMSSMKMRVTITAPRQAEVEKVLVKPAASVTKGQTLVILATPK